MSRGDGFANADLDTEYFRDPNVRRLAREYPGMWIQATLGHIGIILNCWACGKRLTALDAWPDIVPWSDESVAALQDVGLLDRQTRLPASSWTRWYGAAFERRERRRFAGSIGGKQKASNAIAMLGQRQSDAIAMPKQSDTETLPGPSVPTDRHIPPKPSAQRRASGTDLRTKGANPKATGTNPRANGRSARQLREGSAEIDRQALQRLGDLLPGNGMAKTPTDTAEADDWIAGGGNG